MSGFRPVGIVGEVSRPTEVMVNALTPIPSGTYIYVKFKARDPQGLEEFEREVVGIIGSCLYKSLVPVVTAPTISMYGSTYGGTPPLSNLKIESYMTALIIADITGGQVEAPRYPPPPETPVYLAEHKHLSTIYGYKPTSDVEVGSLVGFDKLRVGINVNSLAKHLLITGTTGSGKSNLIAVLADRIARGGGSVVIFDVHGEYRSLESESPNDVDVKPYEAAINPIEMPVNSLVKFIIPEEQASRQRRLLRNALRELNDKIVQKAKSGRKSYELVVKELGSNMSLASDNCVDTYRELLKNYLKKDKAVEDVEVKIDDFFEWHNVDLNVRKVSELISSSRIIVVDVSKLTDDEKDYMLKVIAEDILWYLKMWGRGTNQPIPTLLVVEEAHIFLGERTASRSKEILQRFIREGRKFGGMLAIVSQRPRALDVNVVSQVQNYAFLKLVQRTDRSTVMELTDILSDEYANILPTLPPGHAILMGEWVGEYPAYVRVDRHSGKKVGTTPDITKIWRECKEKYRESVSKALEKKSMISEWEG